jgi:hypothetical protein
MIQAQEARRDELPRRLRTPAGNFLKSRTHYGDSRSLASPRRKDR